MEFEDDDESMYESPEFEILEDWIDDTGWIHYHHSDDQRHFKDGFGDAPHHTGFWMSGLILLDDEDEFIAESFYNGFQLRLQPDGTLIRHPRILDDMDRPVVINRDQMTPILFAVHHYSPEIAKSLYNNNRRNLTLLPLHTSFMYRCMGVKKNYLYRLFGDFLEIWDTIFDIWNLHMGRSREFRNVFVIEGGDKYKINGVDSSIIKSYYRSVISRLRYPTFLAHWNAKLLSWAINVQASFSRYFTLRHNDIDSPPPIHLVWFRVYDKYK